MNRKLPSDSIHDPKLSRRERQIMDILFSKEEASAQDVQTSMSDAPSYSTVRALLARLLDKGVVMKRQDGARYIYSPMVDKQTASATALQRLVKTFFGGSPARAVNALLGGNKALSHDEIAELEALLAKAKAKQKEE